MEGSGTYPGLSTSTASSRRKLHTIHPEKQVVLNMAPIEMLPPGAGVKGRKQRVGIQLSQRKVPDEISTQNWEEKKSFCKKLQFFSKDGGRAHNVVFWKKIKEERVVI